jgi:AraC-like DNA-binding protein
MNDPQPDALSDILDLVRLKACVYFLRDFHKPWGMHIPAGAYAQFHLIVRGRSWLEYEGQRCALSSGDIVVFLRGDSHQLYDHPTSERVPGQQVISSIQSGQALFRQGNGDGSTRLLCGHFEFDRTLAHPFLQTLPRVIQLREQADSVWVDNLSTLLTARDDEPERGSDIIVRRLAEALFIHVLRLYLRQNTTATGFAAALNDRRIHHALQIIHRYADQDLSLNDIAGQIGMSRSALALRFKELLDETPINYLTRWRMLQAQTLLRHSGESLDTIAGRVGYASEAAFSRAFKRFHNVSPGSYRKSK